MKDNVKRWLIKAYVQWIKLISSELSPKFSKVLIFAPHPDDEIIGLGGSIQIALEQGEEVYIVFFTDGENSEASPDKELIKFNRITLSEKVLNTLKIPISQIYRLHLCDGGIPRYNEDGFAEVSDKLMKIINFVRPNSILAPHYLEVWPNDHVACFELARELVRTTNLQVDLWLYWVWTWQILRPWKIYKTLKTRRIDITPFLTKKKAMMDTYLHPVSPNQIPWSGIIPETMLMPFNQPFEVVERYTEEQVPDSRVLSSDKSHVDCHITQ